MKIELNEEHIRVLTLALETYSRLRMGQMSIALETAVGDKNVKTIDHDRIAEIEKLFKEEYFPELSFNSFYGVAADKDGSISNEIYQTLRQYTSIKNAGDEPVDYHWTTNFDEPLHLSGVDLPKIDEDYKHKYIKITHTDIMMAYWKENWGVMWDKIDDHGYPKSSKKSKVVLKDEDLYLQLELPLRK